MDLRTRYLGLELAHPFMVGASPLTNDLDTVQRLEGAGASAITMHSLFEEDIIHHGLRPDQYLAQIHRIKQRIRVPLVASLNGTTTTGWLQYAGMLERAGADAIELNVFHVPTRIDEHAVRVEHRVVDLVAVLKESVRIPLAVKLSPFYSALPHLAGQLDALGADGLVLFNRFYQPDIDPASLEPKPTLSLSDSSELPLRLQAIAILCGQVRASLAITGGVHDGIDALKAILVGADGVQIVSALLRHGVDRLNYIRQAFEHRATRLGFRSIQEMRGRVCLQRLSDPSALTRGNYVRVVQDYVHGGVS
jgi:dihydroorotate dehydrogenase (fumarate)